MKPKKRIKLTKKEYELCSRILDLCDELKKLLLINYELKQKLNKTEK